MTLTSFPVSHYLQWLDRQSDSSREKTVMMFERLEMIDLNKQTDETGRRAIGQSCLKLGANYENLQELGCSAATTCEWLLGDDILKSNQQLETVQALVTALANTHRLPLPDLKWERVLHADYNSVAQEQHVARRNQSEPINRASRQAPLTIPEPQEIEQSSTPMCVIEETLAFDSKSGCFPINCSESVEDFFGLPPRRPATPVADFLSAKGPKPPAEPA